MSDWPEEREDIIGQNGNDGDHYDMQTVHHMLKTANAEGLVTEVVWSLAQSNTGTVQEKCFHALSEWDI